MAIGPRDLKLLWGKAAARCALPRCRKVLIDGSSVSGPAGGTFIGENCHIVAESNSGPRGQSVLSATERNSYANLILLCVEHHTIVDADPNAWPVERLHQIKAEHEVWVETQLTLAPESASDALYSHLVNLATDCLGLSKWDGVSDHAIRSIVPVWFVDGVDAFSEQVFKALWPGTRPELERAIKNLADRSGAFVRQFMEKAYLRHEKFYAEDLRWKREIGDQELRSQLYKQSDEWETQSANLLVNVVVALNEFAEAVRRHLNPRYFSLQGKFTLHDSMGVTNGMQDIHYVPSEYLEVAPKLSA